MRQINDFNSSGITNIGIQYIDDYLKNPSGILVYDEYGVEIYEHKLKMGYIIIEARGLDENAQKDFLNSLNTNTENFNTPTYVANLMKDGNLFVVLRKDHVGEEVINFKGKLLRII